MKDATLEKLTVGFIVLCGVLLVAAIGVVGWAVIEIVQWITSK